MRLRAPFPWFGGKHRAAHLVWPRFGDCPNYIEPFAGSLAVLLRRPHWVWPDGFSDRIHCETVNDIDGLVTNFWRAVKYAPEQTAHWADQPVHELDLHARHIWLRQRLCDEEGLEPALIESARKRGILPFAAWQEASPEHYDCQVAGWWCWGICSWIGDNFCTLGFQVKRPHLSVKGQGVNRQCPHLSDKGRGINRKLRGKDTSIGKCAQHFAALIDWFNKLCDRLRFVDICCGDWLRVLTPAVTVNRASPCAVFLDPPYSQDCGVGTVYGAYHDSTVAGKCREWCLEHGSSPNLRIALCGYDVEHQELERHGWKCVSWKAQGGYGNLAEKNENRFRERIWFSPHCLASEQELLWRE